MAGDDLSTNLKNYMDKKFEKLSEGARESCVDFFTTAVISLRCEKYDDARDKFKELQSESIKVRFSRNTRSTFKEAFLITLSRPLMHQKTLNHG